MNRHHKLVDPIRVMIVDDSAFVRKMIRSILQSDLRVTVVGEAENGLQAIDRIKVLKPNIVTMDIKMPVMDGQEAISQIMASCPVPILVLTDVGDAKEAYMAISRGALDVMGKGEIDPDNPSPFIDKLRILSLVKVIYHLRGDQDKRRNHAMVAQEQLPSIANRVIAIASSTGGPKALATIIGGLAPTFLHPIVVAQHIHSDFVPPLVQWLNGLTPMRVITAQGNETLENGTIYFSPADKHLELQTNGKLSLHDIQTGDIYHPSCNRLLASVANAYGKAAVGIILTGMGDDGVHGMKKIHEHGGVTIAQDEQSSIVFGMPKKAIECGCIDTIAPIGEISAILNGMAVKK